VPPLLTFAEEMNPQLVIENTGRRPDGCYFGFLVIFWIIWTPLTAWATVITFLDFSFFWILLLPFGYVGVLGFPYMLIQSRKPQILESTPDSLTIRGTGIPFSRVVEIPRGQSIKLHFGHYVDSRGGESVVTLNIISGSSLWTRRIMIAPLSHPTEKRQIFRDLRSFLKEHKFNVEVDDDHPKSRSEQDVTPNA
jgi:hypothetical protein